MQEPDYFSTLAAYNRWMNARLYGVCADIPKAERERDRGAFFRSIHGTLNHILLADELWLDRFYGHEPRRPVKALDEILYADFDALHRARLAVDDEICDWIAGLDANWLKGELTFTSLASPRERTLPRSFALQHFFNHQTHHRGQVTTLMMQSGFDPGVTDLLWLPDREAAEAHP